MFLLILSFRQFLYMPSFSAPESEDPSMRGFCRGWWCDSSKEESPNSEKLRTILSSFRNGTFPANQSIRKKILHLISRGYKPATCVSGFFYLFGIADFNQSIKKSYDLLKQGSEAECWACNEILAFHPQTERKSKYLKLANEQGSLFAKYTLVSEELRKQKPNYNSIIKDVYHLAVISASAWIKKHRSGIPFSTCVKQLAGDGKRVKDAWAKMLKLAQNGNHMAALWLLEGVMSNRTNITSKHQAINIMYPYLTNGPWINDYFEIVNSQTKFNKTTALQFFAKMGDEISGSLLSYPSFIKANKV